MSEGRWHDRLRPYDGGIEFLLEGECLLMRVRAHVLALVAPGDNMIIDFDRENLLLFLKYMEDTGQADWVVAEEETYGRPNDSE